MAAVTERGVLVDLTAPGGRRCDECGESAVVLLTTLPDEREIPACEEHIARRIIDLLRTRGRS